MEAYIFKPGGEGAYIREGVYSKEGVYSREYGTRMLDVASTKKSETSVNEGGTYSLLPDVV